MGGVTCINKLNAGILYSFYIQDSIKGIREQYFWYCLLKLLPVVKRTPLDAKSILLIYAKMRTLKIVLSITVLFFFTELIYCQTEKGRILIGGETKLNFTSSKGKSSMNDELMIYSFELSPQLGAFMSKSLAIGIDVQISTESNNDSKNTFLAFAPFIRLYGGSGNIKPFIQGEVGFGKLKEGDMYTSKSKVFLFGIDGGLGIFINKNISLDIGLGYAYISKKYTDYDGKDTLGGIGGGIGFIFIL